MLKEKDYLNNQLEGIFSQCDISLFGKVKGLVDSSYNIRKLDDRLNKIRDYYPITCHFPQRISDEEYDKLSEEEKDNYDFSFFYNSQNKELVEKLKSRLDRDALYELTAEILGKIDESYTDIFWNDFVANNRINENDTAFSQILNHKDLNLGIAFHSLGSSYHIPTGPNYDDYYIDLQRLYTYNDVVTLVHEFLHHANSQMAKSLNTERNHTRLSFSEFVSIYFEVFALEYLIKEKGVALHDIDCSWRIKAIRQKAQNISNYSLLFVYNKYHNIDFQSYQKYLYEEYGYFNQEDILFEEYKEALLRTQNFIFVANDIKKNQNLEKKLPAIIEENVFIDNSHYFGAILAFVMRKCSHNEQVLFFNDYVKGLREKSMIEQANTIFQFVNKIGTDLPIEEMSAFIKEYVPSVAYHTSDNTIIQKSESVNFHIK